VGTKKAVSAVVDISPNSLTSIPKGFTNANAFFHICLFRHVLFLLNKNAANEDISVSPYTFCFQGRE
jgi:hypothetical protein